MISLIKYSKENRCPQVKSRKKNSKKPIYNSIVVKKKSISKNNRAIFKHNIFKKTIILNLKKEQKSFMWPIMY